MFDTGIRQLRLGMSIVWGSRLDAANIGRLIEDAHATMAEFGEPGDDVFFTRFLPLTNHLVEKFLGYPLNPSMASGGVRAAG